jgi:hypothetical protein
MSRTCHALLQPLDAPHEGLELLVYRRRHLLGLV